MIAAKLPVVETNGAWKDFPADAHAQNQIVAALPELIRETRWFGGKSRALENISIANCFNLEWNSHLFFLLIIKVSYKDFEADHYLIPLAKTDVGDNPSGLLFKWKGADGTGMVMDAAINSDFHRCLFDLLKKGTDYPTNDGVLHFDKGTSLPPEETYQFSSNPTLEQSNSSIIFNDKYFMKIYRKLFLEANPEKEMLKFISEEGHYTHVPIYAGSFSWSRKDSPQLTFGLMMKKVNASKSNWEKTGDELNGFLISFVQGAFSINEYVFEQVELLARRTAEMHLALYQAPHTGDFSAEPYNDTYRNWLFDHLIDLLEQRLKMLEQNNSKLDTESKAIGELLSQKQSLIKKFFEQVKTRPLKSLRTRVHGDYHLGQVLQVDGDFIIIDFEGEPESSIVERKIKHSPMKDVAGMIRSFHYAVCAKLYFSHETGQISMKRLQRASDRWFFLIRDTFLETYLSVIGKDNPVYYNKSEINFLLQLHLMEKAIYELGYELNGRPDWVKIPLKGIEQVIHELEKYLE